MTVQSQAIDLMDLDPFIAGTENTLLSQLREREPLHWNEEPNGPGFWSVTRYEDVVRVVMDPQTFINGEGTQILSRKVEGSTSTVHNTDPPRHGKLRKLAAPHLRAVKIQAWQEVIDRSVSAILDDIEQRGEVEFVKSAAALLPIQALGQVLGVPLEDCGLLLDWTNRVVSDDPEYMTRPDEKERARAEMFAYFEELSEQRRREPRNDIVSKLVHAELDGEPLPWADLAAYYFVLVGAGNETTRNLLTGTVLAFHEFPDEWRKLERDRTLLKPAIEEMLRYITPIRAMRRTATRDVEWDGRTIRAGDKIVCWFQAANRDPAVFSDPDLVRIDREDNEHVGFGWGIHACMGSHLARAEVTSFLTQVLDRGLRITPLAAPDRLHSNQFHAFKRLRVRIEKGDRS
ncbi:cytochrome P450 [Gordonia rubripertincta]|uniref:Cytochrome P450 n=3 Tax=Gordonia TaxID=2053 RepID=A0AAW6RE83_GORRU|nr:cytochrome P450 [Gordonia rubripertincta]ASR02063.1 Steroid C26-monooxygenase [Gordonia rubripertincta]MDG6782415.1 cytochrome P450 [Gordonia rubripertincta]NKY64512.1 cytochrome P450 [Gordonia rubripertincta]GAB84921.1 putative cytochrome P450 [Gordonia rubripertincta NBRC 101908]